MDELRQALDEVCDCTYPAGIDDVERRCQGMEIELKNGSRTTLGEMLDTLDDPPDEFESTDELYSTLMSLAPRGSVGRIHYDDRGTVEDDRDQQSF